MSTETTVTVDDPIVFGIPLILFVDGSKVTPSGSPETVLVTVVPLLSVAIIIMSSIGLNTSFVWFAIGVTFGAVVSTILIEN
ncbi:Uncharacterised protein [Staphylococcus caeli]|uniref:Uncharacterized protein n=1 Tax=Staphylococcus caeli TaxID=2201815 RepID=A0A1D4K179_9STAP|nr:Uncharacterised protein [Staphylococcus caeli]SCS85220.1 Uncharacterised protein [Staphylococcus caeli]